MAKKPPTTPKPRSRHHTTLTAAQIQRHELRARKREQQQIASLSKQLERLIAKSDSYLRGLGEQLAARFDLIDWSRTGAAAVRRGERAEKHANDRQARTDERVAAGERSPRTAQEIVREMRDEQTAETV